MLQILLWEYAEGCFATVFLRYQITMAMKQKRKLYISSNERYRRYYLHLLEDT
jgi:hypothetical protein